MADKQALGDAVAILLTAALMAMGLSVLAVASMHVAGVLWAPRVWQPGWLGWFALTLVLFVPCFVPASRVGPVLRARYDDAALQVMPPLAAGELDASAPWVQATRDALRQWCFEGAGDGRSPLWRPLALPHVERRFAIAALTGRDSASRLDLAEAFSREIDGALQLEKAQGSAGRWGLKLRVKWQDCLWWRKRQPGDPWDSGYLVAEAVDQQRLRAFLPRRATLIVAAGLPAATLREAIADLSARQRAFRHPVRLLVIDTALSKDAVGPIAVIDSA